MHRLDSVQDTASPEYLIERIEHLLHTKQSHGLTAYIDYIAHDPESMQRLQHLCQHSTGEPSVKLQHALIDTKEGRLDAAQTWLTTHVDSYDTDFLERLYHDNPTNLKTFTRTEQQIILHLRAAGFLIDTNIPEPIRDFVSAIRSDETYAAYISPLLAGGVGMLTERFSTHQDGYRGFLVGIMLYTIWVGVRHRTRTDRIKTFVQSDLFQNLVSTLFPTYQPGIYHIHSSSNNREPNEIRNMSSS